MQARGQPSRTILTERFINVSGVVTHTRDTKVTQWSRINGSHVSRVSILKPQNQKVSLKKQKIIWWEIHPHQWFNDMKSFSSIQLLEPLTIMELLGRNVASDWPKNWDPKFMPEKSKLEAFFSWHLKAWGLPFGELSWFFAKVSWSSLPSSMEWHGQNWPPQKFPCLPPTEREPYCIQVVQLWW